MEDTTQSTAQAFVTALESEGVRHIFGVPGEENLDILQAIKTSSIEFVPTRHEQAAGFMAATVGRLTGTPGVALSTLGPGATNLMTAAAYAQLGAMPMIMITGQKPIRESKQGSFQIIDIVSMMSQVTKYSKTLVEGRLAPSFVREAFRLASEERPGAALIEIPEDVAAEQVKTKLLPITHTRRPVAEAKAIRRTIDLLKAAKKPLIIVGAGANRKRTSNMLTKLVESHHIPFSTTQMGKGVIDETRPEFAGTAALSAHDYVHRSIEQADLIINVGHDVVEKPPFIMEGDRTVVHIDFQPASVNEIYYPQVEVVGDIANAIWQIKEELDSIDTSKLWDTDYHTAHKAQLDKDFSGAVEASSTITPQFLVHQIRKSVPHDGVVTLDNGMYKLYFARHFEARFENTLLLDNALATMGAGLPSAIATKLVHQEKKVVAVVGDGGFMMNSQEVETAIRLNLDIVIVILNDQKFQMIRWKQVNEGHQEFGMEFGNPDFKLYAESYGAKGYTAHTPEEFSTILESTLNEKGVHIIDTAIDYSKNAESLIAKEA